MLKKITVVPEVTEEQILGEIESLGGMKKVYEKEIRQLKAKLKTFGGIDKLEELNLNLKNSNNKYNELEQKKKDLERITEKLAKQLEKNVKAQENYSKTYEENKRIKILNKEYEKTNKLEIQIKIQADSKLSKIEKANMLEANIASISEEVKKFKEEASVFSTINEDNPVTSVSQLKRQMLKTKREFKNEMKQNKDIIDSLNEQLIILKKRCKELTQVSTY